MYHECAQVTVTSTFVLYSPIVNGTLSMADRIIEVPLMRNDLLCALAGVTWYMQFFFYSMGQTLFSSLLPVRRLHPVPVEFGKSANTPNSTMPVQPETSPAPEGPASVSPPTKEVRRSRLRKLLIVLIVLICPLVVARAMLPRALRWYVNRTIDRSPLYEGRIGDIEVNLWRGAYTIHDMRLIKRTGTVPVPFFSARQMDLAIQWNALLHGKSVGRIIIEQPELNFVDAPDSAESQSGEGPWLQIIRDLFPFKINSTVIHNAAVHFRAYQATPPVDIYLSQIDGTIDNLTNIYNETNPLVATVNATGKAMDQADFQFKMKIDPFSYRPTFQLAVRLLGLDVTKLNNFTKRYGTFDFKSGWFDLVVEVDAKEGNVQGYVKPLFRNVQILSLVESIKNDNAVQFFWEALLGVTTQVLKNAPRDQFATVIPFVGDIGGPAPDILATVGNILRNAFVRAYLPRLEGLPNRTDEIHFEPGSIVAPESISDTSE